MAAQNDPIQLAFNSAIRDFKANLKNEDLYCEILDTTSIDQVYDATDKLQKEQGASGHLRHLSKIEPYLRRLGEYTGAVEVFVQAKPDILALLWGPIKLILQWANVLKQSFDAIVDTLEEIGLLLPEFKEVARVFAHSHAINEVLVLFFRDILDFYLVALKFFSLSRLKVLFEMLWPSRREKIKMVSGLIERHALLMRAEVRMEEIREAYDSRQREMKHFEIAEKAAIQQDYLTLRTHISPKGYDDALYRFQESVCDGTGKWLFRDEGFKNWLDPLNSAVNVLWLKGIPGAGKTLLAATVIKHTQSLTQTLSVFLTYKNHGITAISVLHSLIFQLAESQHTVKAALCQSNIRNLKSNLNNTCEVLQSLLGCAGPVYIIIDGIDEIEEVERVKLLKQMLDVASSCREVRILLCSRPESDINTILKEKATEMTVDQRNSGSIQIYVNRRKEEWFQERQFVPEARAEIEQYIAPLAAIAKGMFLYVRVIFDVIRQMDSVEQICHELKNPPESLDDAYKRIFDRINKSENNFEKTRARKILGWVGCAPSPLTKKELEHALIVSLDDIAGTARVISESDFVRTCGPIIEVVDEYVQFVHFTAKQYIFNAKVEESILVSDMTLSLTICCITYLSQPHHDLDLDEEEIEHNFLSGAYRFHNFSSNFWFELLKDYLELCKGQALPEELVHSLELLYAERSTSNHQDAENTTLHNTNPTFGQIFKTETSPLSEMLESVTRFHTASLEGDYRVNQPQRWIHLDPLTLSQISINIHKCLDEMLCQTSVHDENCTCFAVFQHHGHNVFKCGFLKCQFSRQGFNRRSDRKTHENNHKNLWKCDIPGCEYAVIGFITRNMRDYHLQESHRSNEYEGTFHTIDINTEEIQPLLFDLVTADKVEAVRVLASQMGKLSTDVQQQLAVLAASIGSCAMLQIIMTDNLIERDSILLFIFLSKISVSAIEAGNIDTSIWLVENMGFWLESNNRQSILLDLLSDILGALISSDSYELYEIWKKDLGTVFGRQQDKGYKLCAAQYIVKSVISATENTPSRERVLASFWDEMGILKTIDNKYLGDALVNVAHTTCSIALAEQLIEAGAKVDWRRSPKYPTPLYCAAKKDTQEAAKLMEYLLLCGADPFAEVMGINRQSGSNKGERPTRKLKDEIGAAGISKWLGITWEELVARTERLAQNH